MKRIAAAALGAVLLVSTPASAQYFGRNKVQYDQFAFEILETPHFDIYFYAAERDAAQFAGALAERWYARLSESLDHRFSRRQPIILYASHSHFSQTSILPGAIADGMGGFTDHLAGRVVLPFAAGLADTDHVLGHEIVHAFQREILRKNGRSLAMVPLWFSEGMAEYLSIRELDANTRMWLRDALATERLPTLAQLDDPRYFPYRFGQPLWAFLADRFGEQVVVKALGSKVRGNVLARLQQATGRPVAVLSREWHDWVKDQVDRGEAGTTVDGSTALVSPERNGGRMNLGPALSPDGRYVVFLSERDGVSMDLFLADAHSGAILRKILNTATDPHFDSLEFLDSAGAWDQTGRRFALATLRDGHPVLTVLELPSGVVTRELPIANVDQIFNPSFSPDGRRVVVCAMKGGFSDLYVIDLSTGAADALTTDPASDLQPAWSPDGTRIAFATDRFSSAIDALSFGPYQLATIDLASRVIALAGGAPGGKSIDPHWSADGRQLYFVSDASGVSNVHRLDLATGVVRRITDVRNGVSGITALSPSISLQADGALLAYSQYVRGAYEIRTTALEDDRPTGPPLDDRRIAARTIAPPLGTLAEDLRSAADRYPVHAYVPRLSIVSLGQPYMSAGGGAFGSFLRAGMSLGFVDMLGEQQLQAAVQAGKSLTDFAVQTSYVNRRSRWNWGIIAAQVPSFTGSSQVDSSATLNDQRVAIRDSTLFHQIHRQASVVIVYPFNRSTRFETTFGVDRVTFGRETTTSTYSTVTGKRLSETRSEAAAADPAAVFETSAALVYDNAVMGATAPILGQRYRLALAPTFGDVSVVTAVADYRRYFMPVRPFTIATRIEHVARYGAGADDPRLLPIVWTLRDLVRGFATDSAMLRTSQFDVANLELRFPLAGAFSGRIHYGALPIELLAFADGGRFAAPRSLGLNPQFLASAGAGARINAAGLVFEFTAARPFSGSDRGWRLAANFSPGF